MFNPAISTINPAATCPAWCAAGHERDTLIPDDRGGWDALHYSPPVAVQTCEQLPEGVAKAVTVQTETYVCETPSECRPRVVWVSAVDEWDNTEAFAVTARQALRLAEVLVQQAAAILAEETTTTTAATVTR